MLRADMEFKITLRGQPLERVTDLLAEMRAAGVDVEVESELGLESDDYTVGLFAAGDDYTLVAKRIRDALDYIDRFIDR